jgi:hypothetical protein
LRDRRSGVKRPFHSGECRRIWPQRRASEDQSRMFNAVDGQRLRRSLGLGDTRLRSSWRLTSGFDWRKVQSDFACPAGFVETAFACAR